MPLEKQMLKNSLVFDCFLLSAILLLMMTILWRDAHSSWSFDKKHGSVTDNFYIALNAKNISQGKGWGLYNGVEFVPFEREISTGPVVFLPAALAMQVWEDFDDARYAGVIGLNMALLIFFLWRLKHFFIDKNIYRYLWLLVPLLMLSFMREQWYLVLGEVAASLLLLISASYVAGREITPRHILLSGLFAGMALMSKLISILCSPWILLFLFVVSYRPKEIRENINNVFIWLAAFCVIPALVAVWHWVGIGQGWVGFMAYTIDYLAYYFGLGWSGEMASTICIDQKCLAANHRVAATSWLHPLGGYLATLIVWGVPSLLILSLIYRHQTSLQKFILLVALMSSAHLLFFYANGIHWQSRYYFIAGFIGMAAAFLLLGEVIQGIRRDNLRRVLLCGFLIAAIGGSLPWFRVEGMNTSHRDARDAAAYINRSSDINEVLWLNYAPYPFPFVDYYLQRGKTWMHSYGFLSKYFFWHEKELSIDSVLFWKEPQSHYVLQEKWEDGSIVSPNVCVEILFENEHFFVLNCRPDEIEAFYRIYTEGKIQFGRIDE